MSGSFAKQLEEAMIGADVEKASVGPVDEGGFIVKLMRLRHDNYPGRDAHGVLPLVVVGHESMNQDSWNRWVRENGVTNFGAAYTEKLIRDGIELKEMLPMTGFGRAMRKNGLRSDVHNYSYVDRAGEVLTMVEKWPSLYNSIAEEMAEQEMTLEKFVRRVENLPSPLELGRGADTTLGDLLPPLNGMVLPGER